jgi:hypothetical protein
MFTSKLRLINQDLDFAMLEMMKVVIFKLLVDQVSSQRSSHVWANGIANH